MLACGRTQPARRAIERVAIVPFDNQSANVAANQLGTQVAQIAALELGGSPDAFVFVMPSAAEAPQRRATQVVLGNLVPQSGHWTLHAHLRDPAVNRTLRSLVVSGSSAGELADGLAAQLGKPAFSAGALDQARLLSALQGNTSDLSWLSDEGARLGLAPLPTDLQGRATALVRLSELAPANSDVATQAAAALLQIRQFGPAAQAYQRARRADPDWAQLHNEAAFGFALAGDLPGALAAIEDYRKLDPKGANPDDSRGEILCLHRRFDEAARAFLAAYDKDPSFFAAAPLRKAAEARRAAGDQAEADALFARYKQANVKRPLIELEQARWDYASGRVKEAFAALESLAPKVNASAAWTQLAAWRAANGSGDAAGAAQLAMKTAKSPAEEQAALVALFATQADTTPAEWQARAAKQFPHQAAALGREALVYAYVLRKHWSEALPLIAAQRDSLPPTQAGFWQPLLAQAYAQTGQTEKSKAESRFAQIPRTIGDATWDFLALSGS